MYQYVIESDTGNMELPEILAVILKLFLVSLLLILSLIYLYLRKDYDYWEKRGISFIKPVFIFGNLKFIMRKCFWDFFYEVGKKYREPYVGIFLGHKPALLIQNADLARNILVRDSAFFEDRFIYADKSDPIGNINLFNVKNPVWQDIRKELNPMFTPSRLKTLMGLMTSNAQLLVKRIQREYVEKKNPVCLKDLFSRYTSDTVSYTVFGLQTSALNEDDNPLWYISSNIVNWTFRRGFEFSIMFYVPAVAGLLRLKFFSEAATDYLKKVFKTVVEDRLKSGKTNDRDLVSQLLKVKDDIKIPENEGPEYAENLMIAQAAGFIFGAIGTSTATLTYCLHELSHHPEKQDKLYSEIEEEIKRSGKGVLGFDELSEMRYLNSCIQETLRKYTPIPHLDRLCGADYKIDNQLTIERGTPVFINLEAIHHDEHNYPEPSRWLPERFTGVAADSDNRNFTFLPFGEGPRFCIGKRYGMNQIRAALAQVVHKYRLEPAGPYEVPSDPYSLVLSPKGGGVVTFVPRAD